MVVVGSGSFLHSADSKFSRHNILRVLHIHVVFVIPVQVTEPERSRRR